MTEGMDISKIVGIIMENPEIIGKIRALADESSKSTNEDGDKTEAEPAAEKEDEAISTVVQKPIEEASKKNSVPQSDKRRRNELLCALKPYVSSERAKAIDTILSVVDVWELLKARPK